MMGASSSLEQATDEPSNAAAAAAVVVVAPRRRRQAEIFILSSDDDDEQETNIMAEEGAVIDLCSSCSEDDNGGGAVLDTEQPIKENGAALKMAAVKKEDEQSGLQQEEFKTNRENVAAEEISSNNNNNANVPTVRETHSSTDYSLAPKQKKPPIFSPNAQQMRDHLPVPERASATASLEDGTNFAAPSENTAADDDDETNREQVDNKAGKEDISNDPNGLDTSLFDVDGEQQSDGAEAPISARKNADTTATTSHQEDETKPPVVDDVEKTVGGTGAHGVKDDDAPRIMNGGTTTTVARGYEDGGTTISSKKKAPWDDADRSSMTEKRRLWEHARLKSNPMTKPHLSVRMQKFQDQLSPLVLVTSFSNDDKEFAAASHGKKRKEEAPEKSDSYVEESKYDQGWYDNDKNDDDDDDDGPNGADALSDNEHKSKDGDEDDEEEAKSYQDKPDQKIENIRSKSGKVQVQSYQDEPEPRVEKTLTKDDTTTCSKTRKEKIANNIDESVEKAVNDKRALVVGDHAARSKSNIAIMGYSDLPETLLEENGNQISMQQTTEQPCDSGPANEKYRQQAHTTIAVHTPPQQDGIDTAVNGIEAPPTINKQSHATTEPTSIRDDHATADEELEVRPTSNGKETHNEDAMETEESTLPDAESGCGSLALPSSATADTNSDSSVGRKRAQNDESSIEQPASKRTCTHHDARENMKTIDEATYTATTSSFTESDFPEDHANGSIDGFSEISVQQHSARISNYGICTNSGWWEGNGISRDRAAVFKGMTKQCGSCTACERECCGKCSLCQFGNFTPPACVLRCCEQSNERAKDLYAKELGLMIDPGRSSRCLKAGTRVYCRWDKNNEWYWGEIRTVYKDRNGTFTVDFDDGDVRYNVHQRDIFDEFEYAISVEETRLSRSESTSASEMEAPETANNPLSSQTDCYCGRCFNCTKANCGQCAVCRNDIDPNGKFFSKNICLQKMCIEIPLEQKAMNAPGLPDSKWKFAFTDPAKNQPSTKWSKGLRLLPPNGRRYCSIDRAISHNPSFAGTFDPGTFYKFVGLPAPNIETDESDDVPLQIQSPIRKSRAYSSKKVVGARCYSRFTNCSFYWGRITKISGSGNNLTYSILFDDSDSLDNVPSKDVLTETDYIRLYQENPPEPIDENANPNASALSLHDLYKERCGMCAMCKKKDCSSCSACQFNQTSTTIHRRVCLFKMCHKKSEAEKAQPLHVLPVGWKFYFTDSDDKRISRFHPSLRGLRIISDHGKVFPSLESALKTCRYTKSVTEDKIQEFYEKYLGLKLRYQLNEHELLGMGFYREWTDAKGRRREAYGTIRKCWKSLKEQGDDLTFTVEYEPFFRALNKDISGPMGNMPSVDNNVSEEDAWGGYLAYAREEHNTDPSQKVPRNCPFHYNWIVPRTCVRKTSSAASPPTLEMVLAPGFLLAFKAKKSSIRNAGLGLWVTCSPVRSELADRLYLELPPGTFVDLGVYAPLQQSDRKTDTVSLLKNFIHNWECESWNFDMAHHDKGALDITDDCSGDLHEKAKANTIVYVNETDGRTEIPSIYPFHDPEGAVHYYMGHKNEDHGALRIPVNGKPMELKIDYGPNYEKVRVRKNYSRLCVKSELEKLKKTIREDDADTVAEISHFSANDVYDALSFLERLFSENWNASQYKLQRTLIVALALNHRVKSILKEFEGFDLQNGSFCDEGYTEMDEKRTVNRSKNAVIAASRRWGGEESLKEAVLSMDLLKSAVAASLGMAASELGSFSASELLDRIESL